MRIGLAWMVAVLAACTPTPAGPDLPTPAASVVPAGAQEAAVIGVDDGDSLTVDFEGVVERVRLIGINAPELDECWGAEARDALARVVGRDVRLEFDTSERDQFDRLLAYVWVDDTLLNVHLVRGGSAFVNVVPPNTTHATVLRAAQEGARSSRTGVWAPCGGDDAPPGLVIVGVDANPPGPDEDRLGEESITLANVGTEPISLGGFIVRDASTAHRYTIPDAATLRPGTRVRIVTGCGPDTATTLHWCATGPIWNNDGDTALIQTESGTIVAYFAYGS